MEKQALHEGLGSTKHAGTMHVRGGGMRWGGGLPCGMTMTSPADRVRVVAVPFGATTVQTPLPAVQRHGSLGEPPAAAKSSCHEPNTLS